MKTRLPLLRDRADATSARVTNIELFFDLVFAFAVTQLSHRLLGDLTPLGALQTTILFLAVWWVWINTSWVTNWLDPERWPVRLGLFVLMLLGLVLSTSLPKAFGDRGLAFAAAYVVIQVGRSLFTIWALGDGQSGNRRNFQRIAIWAAGSGLFWLAGGLLQGTPRLVLWAIGLGLDFLSPSLGFWVPWLGRSTTADWDVAGGHIAERCSLFILIALGEGLLVTGATVADLSITPVHVAAFVTAFVGSAAFWWIYFDTGAERGSKHIEEADDPGRWARLQYTYIHLMIVAGIIVGAVGDELLLAHPDHHLEPATIATVIGGPVMFLAGNLLFKGIARARPPLSHLVGLGLLGGLTLLGLRDGSLTTLGLVAATNAILCLVAAWETLSLRRPSRTSLKIS